jgi:hypothetical protein
MENCVGIAGSSCLLPKKSPKFAPVHETPNKAMAIDIRTPKDHSKIDLNNLGEFIWWSHHLGIGPEELLFIIEKVGAGSKAVREYYWLNRPVSPSDMRQRNSDESSNGNKGQTVI